MARRSRDDIQFEPSEALQQNRARMEAARDKVASIQRGELNIGPSSRQARRSQPQAAQTPRFARSASGRESDFELIMGKDGKAIKTKVRVKDEVLKHVEEKGKGRSDMRPSSLHIPIARPQRLSTADGRTSFHFSHDSITKTRNAVVKDNGQVNKPGAAKAHNRYIERESAVAIDDEGIVIDPESGNEAKKEKASSIEDEAVLTSDKQEMYFDRPLSPNFLRTYRTNLGTLLSDIDPDPRGEPADRIDGMRNVPGRDLVPESASAQMLLRADEIPVVGRDRNSDQGMRRTGDGNTPGNGAVSLPPVPRRLSRDTSQDAADVEKVIAALGGRTPKPDQSTPDGQGKYIERQEALAIQPDGSRVLYTNIDADAEKRAEFWRLVEEHEREADSDRMTFRIDQNPKFWQNVIEHKDCPKELYDAIEGADPSIKVTVTTESNIEMRRFLSSVEGWKDVGVKSKDETNEEYKQRKLQAIASFQDGRGGRVQYRIIGELPHELDVKGRASILKEFSDEFAKRNLPFVAVMHAPDHTNDDKNWHFHLVYYDRPCSRLDQARIDEHFNNLNPTSKMTRADVHVGQWDFTVVEEKKDKWRNKWIDHPFAQNKAKEVSRDQKWIELLRKKLATITNDHLEKAGVQRRLDPRRHSEMGIHSNPQEHLGTKLANLEAMGIATPLGVSNEERQWDAMQRKLEHDIERRRSVINDQAKKWLEKAEKADHITDPQRAFVRATVLKWHQHKTEAEEHIAIAENVTQHIERTVSRALKVKETCEKQLAAIDAGKVTRFQASRAEILKDKSSHAVMWLEETNKLLQDERNLVADCKKKAQMEELVSEKLEIDIERALAPVTAREIVEETKKKEKAETERAAQVANDNERQDQERRNALVKAQMDKWIASILSENRRLVRQGTKVVPLEISEADKEVLGAINANAMQPRLAGIKKQQDARVKNVVRELTKYPQNLIIQKDGKQERFILVTANRQMAKDFSSFANDPAIIKAREAAIEANRVRAEELATQGKLAPPSVAQNQKQSKPANVEAVRKPKAAEEVINTGTRENTEKQQAQSIRYALQERIVRTIRDDSIRVLVRDGKALLNEKNLRRLNIEPENLDDPNLQKRLVSIAAVQDREIRRLTAYAKSNPDRIVEKDGRAVLASKAPRELVEISNKWKDDDSIDIALKSIREEARMKDRQTQIPLAPATPAERVEKPKAEKVEETKEAAKPQAEPAKPKVAPPQPVSKVTALETDYSMREEARKYAELERKKKEAQEAALKRASRKDKTGEDDISRAIRVASQKASTKGAHVLIDNWIMAVQDGATPEQRQQIALNIINEKAAREKLDAIDRQVAQRIRQDAEKAKEDKQLGLGLDIGQTPKR